MRIARFLLVVALLAGLPMVASTAAAAVTLTARGSLNQVQVWGADPGATLELTGGALAQPVQGTADDDGAYIFGIAPESTDDVPAGTGYTVHQGTDVSNAVDVFDLATAQADPPDQSFYDDQDLHMGNGTGVTGFGYIETRDHTTLSANVLPPLHTDAFSPGDTDGPWPVVINYSGYTPSKPGDSDPVTQLFRGAGYAVVGVNLRGTGCSGGAYSYFERLQGFDGYDVVEAIAAQDWVRRTPGGDPMVGMVGISFPGISQLFVGRTNPPSLRAIAPTSVIADTYRSTLYPGGILNNGFASDWAGQREAYAEPYGEGWEQARVDAGDQECEDNQVLHTQAPPLLARFEHDLLYAPDPGDDLAPATFVDEIQVPTFIAGSFQDEQTGGHWSTMLSAFDPDVLKRAVLFNGTHADALGPDLVRDQLEFLDIYVTGLAPRNHAVLRGSAPGLGFDGVFGEPYAIPPLRPGITNAASYEAQPKFRLLWERGAEDAPGCIVEQSPEDLSADPRPCTTAEGAGSPFARFETTSTVWPPPRTARTWFLEPDGALGDAAPTVPDDEPRGWSSYRYDNSRDQVRTFHGGTEDIWQKSATYDWDRPPEGDSLRYVTPPFASAAGFAGTGSVDLWLRSTAEDVDLEVTLTELRPDGDETYVQSGWLRASERQEAPGSTALAPVHTHLVHEPLPPGEFVRARVELFPFAHVVRPGSRLALTIAAPGGNRPFWQFDSVDAAPDTVNDIGHSVARPSQLNLPLLSGFALPGAATALLPCGQVRSQPCRTAQVSTRPTAVTGVIDAGDTATDLDRGIDVDWTAPAAPEVTGNHVIALPTGEESADEDADPGHRVPVAVGTPPPTDTAVAVTADFGAEQGQRSDASPDVVPDHPFTDVARNAWNVAAVDWVAAWQVAEGFSDGTFRNGATVTRGQFVTWLWTMFGRPSGSPPHGYIDVPSATVSAALAWAKAENIVTAPGTRFNPRRTINRAQIAFWLWAAASRPEDSPDAGFTDVPDDAWYATAVNWAKDQGVVVGFPGDLYRPTADATRGQAANMFRATAASIHAAG